MNSKQRVETVLNLGIPDQIPYGEYCIDYDTVEKLLGHETYVRAKAKCTIAFWEGRRDEVVQSFKEDMVELYRKLDCVDLINLGAPLTGIGIPPKNAVPDPPKKIDEGVWEDREGRIYRYSDVTEDIVMVHDPHIWEREYTPDNFPADAEFERPDETIFEALDEIIGQFQGERFLLGPSGEEVGMVLLGGMERGLTEYLTNPKAVRAAGAYFVRRGNYQDPFYIRDGIDGIYWGQDYSYKSGPMISPELFRSFVLPNLKARAAHVKATKDLPIIKHSCGNNWKLMEMFLEIGFCCYQSIQHSAGMDIREVKEAYGDKLCLWGGIPVEDLVSGTREDIRRDVRYAVEYAARNGAYILGSTHSIAVGCKYDNYMTMLEEFDRLKHCY